MPFHRTLRQRLRVMVLETKTVSGRLYNFVVFGTILLSVLALMLDPDPLNSSFYSSSPENWIHHVQNLCLTIFTLDFFLITRANANLFREPANSSSIEGATPSKGDVASI